MSQAFSQLDASVSLSPELWQEELWLCLWLSNQLGDLGQGLRLGGWPRKVRGTLHNRCPSAWKEKRYKWGMRGGLQ